MTEHGTMRALSLWQPVASLIAHGAIRVETRTWATTPGPVVIHAGKSRSGLNWLELPVYRNVMNRLGLTKADLPFGAAIAVCDITEVRSTDTWTPNRFTEEYRLGDYDPGRYAFILDNVRLLPEPVPVTGRQQMWRMPDDAHDAVLEQLTRPHAGSAAA